MNFKIGNKVKIREKYLSENAILKQLGDLELTITNVIDNKSVELSNTLWVPTRVVTVIEDTDKFKFKKGDKVMMTSKKASSIPKDEFPIYVESMEEYLDKELIISECEYIERHDVNIYRVETNDVSFNFREDWLEYYDINKLKAEKFEELSESMYVLRGDLWGRDLRVQPNSATLDYFIKSVRDNKSIVWFENTEYFDYGITMRLKEVKELAEYLNKIVELAEEVK